MSDINSLDGWLTDNNKWLTLDLRPLTYVPKPTVDLDTPDETLTIESFIYSQYGVVTICHPLCMVGRKRKLPLLNAQLVLKGRMQACQ